MNPIDHFINVLWLEEGLANNTLTAYQRDLRQLEHWLQSSHDLALLRADGTLLSEYAFVRHEASKASSANRRLSVFKRFFRWALREGLISSDPTLKLVSAKQAMRVPSVMSEHQVEALLAAPLLNSPYGLRDRAMLELMYASGLRVSELISLKTVHLGLTEGALRVTGKGSKERLTPFGDEARSWLLRYLGCARGEILGERTSDVLFVAHHGGAMSRQMFWRLIKNYAIRAGIMVSISPHTLRHAFATHLLANGADLRVIQTLLGHADVATTEIYTHVLDEHLTKLVLTRHPLARKG